MRLVPPILSLLALISFLVGSSTTAVAQGYDDVPGEVVFGIALGGGSAGASIDADTEVLASTERNGGFAGNFRFGYELYPGVVFGVEFSGWLGDNTEEIDGVTLDTTTRVGTGTISVTWFPTPTGFFLRGGIGGGRIEQEFEAEGNRAKWNDSGFGLQAAVGFQWRIRPNIGLGPQVDFGYVDLGKTTLESTSGDPVPADVSLNYFNVSLLADLYF
jgi:hypothetical protein